MTRTKLLPCEGESLVPSFTSNSLDHGPLFWEREGNVAVRLGNWKLVSKYPGPWELHDMEVDRTEMHNISAEYTDMVTEMREKYKLWAQTCGVFSS